MMVKNEDIVNSMWEIHVFNDEPQPEPKPGLVIDTPEDLNVVEPKNSTESTLTMAATMIQPLTNPQLQYYQIMNKRNRLCIII
jgi:hypothetical protein